MRSNFNKNFVKKIFVSLINNAQNSLIEMQTSWKIFSVQSKLILRVCLVHVFKQQFSVFLEIYVGEQVCENTCNIV